jgi:hypothetical protein
MSPASVSIPDDLAACQELLRQQAEVTSQQSETIDQQHQQIEKLRHELELFKRYLFGQRRERFVDPAQGKLFEIEPDEHDVTAPKPPQPIEKGLAGPGLLAFVAGSKLADHLPLNRLEDILTRYGVHLARSTQCDWMAGCAKLARPLYELMICLVLQSKVLGTDDTTVRLRDRELDRTRTAYFWAYVGDCTF